MDIAALRIELDAGHPDTGAYNVSDTIANDELNAINRPSVGDINELRNFWLLEQKTNQNLFGRLQIVATASVGTDPLSEVTLTLEHITAAISMLSIVTAASEFSLDLNDSRFDSILIDLAASGGAQIITPGQKNSIQALSNNLQSRVSEINLGKSIISDVTKARAQ